MPDDTYLTIQQIAQRLQISERTVRRWVLEKDESKRLPAILISSRYRILERDLKVFLDKHKR